MVAGGSSHTFVAESPDECARAVIGVTPQPGPFPLLLTPPIPAYTNSRLPFHRCTLFTPTVSLELVGHGTTIPEAHALARVSTRTVPTCVYHSHLFDTRVQNSANGSVAGHSGRLVKSDPKAAMHDRDAQLWPMVGRRQQASTQTHHSQHDAHKS